MLAVCLGLLVLCPALAKAGSPNEPSFYLSDYSQQWTLVAANNLKAETSATFHIVSGQLAFLSEHIAFADDSVLVTSCDVVDGDNAPVPATTAVLVEGDYKVLRVSFNTPVTITSSPITVAVAYALFDTQALCRGADDRVKFHPDWASEWADSVVSNAPSVTYSFVDSTQEVVNFGEGAVSTSLGRVYDSMPPSWDLSLKVSEHFAHSHHSCPHNDESRIPLLVIGALLVFLGTFLVVLECVDGIKARCRREEPPKGEAWGVSIAATFIVCGLCLILGG